MRPPPGSAGPRVLLAPDKFAGTLTAAAAAAAMAAGWRIAAPDTVTDQVPMADGGPGFLAALAAGLGGTFVDVRSSGPLGEPVTAQVLVDDSGDPPTAYVEAAQTCGLARADRSRPWEATTAGLAAVLCAALSAGAARVVVGVGGTATTDGGRGVVEAIGQWPPDVHLVVATDVTSRLLGSHGAARGFGPQKGADPAMVARLDRRLAEWAAATGGDPDAPGSGAGGGLGYGLALLGGQLLSGASRVADLIDLNGRIAEAEVVLTGEGCLDWSSLRGKVVAEVAGRARDAGRPCLVLAGQVRIGPAEAAAAGISEAWSVTNRVGSVAGARANPERELSRLAEQVAGLWSRRRAAGGPPNGYVTMG